MGLDWGIVSGRSEYYSSKEEFLDKWQRFCEWELSWNFVVVFDDVFYKFQKPGHDAEVIVTSREDPELLAEMKSLNIGEGTSDQFCYLMAESIDIFVPELCAEVWEIPESWGFGRRLLIGCLAWLHYTEFEDMDEGTRRLAKQLSNAAAFCQKHRILLRISWEF